MRKTTACAVLLVGALSVAGSAANAEPITDRAPAPQPVPEHQAVELNGVHFTVDRAGGSIVISAPDGAFETVDGSVVVRDAAGKFNDSLPLSYRKDDQVFPIAAVVAGHSVRLTPSLTDGHAVTDPITAADIARGQQQAAAEPVSESFTPRDLNELGLFAARAGVAAVGGAAIGALVGATAGCVAGGIAGSVSAGATTLLGGLLPGAVVGCIAGVAVLGALGTIGGYALAAGPVIMWSAYQYFSTVTSPCTAPGPMCVNPAAPVPAN
ncbi:hypothetical protein [Nocardia sp. alder85J]|uniref:hypothetical protein n=1 Tax=Nocardia sp. alder85J TaxID=2862949 RepID=UPI001CD68727|nr:hypothetical protein [Nocardia sp. alder85J]MCX4094769.1 hypothetical protein [Nocardia sp. alder85J]